MDDRQKKLDEEMVAKQLEESAARLRMLEAKAEKRKAGAAMAEVSGLQALQDRVRKQLDDWRKADLKEWDAFKSQLKQGAETLKRGSEAADARLEKLAEVDDRRLDAEMAQADGAMDVLDAKLGQQWIEDKRVGATVVSGLQKAYADAQAKQKAFAAAAKEQRDEAREKFAASVHDLEAKFAELANKLKGEGKSQRAQSHA